MANAKNSWCLFPSQMTADTLLHELMCFYIVYMNTKVTRCLFVLDVLLKYILKKKHLFFLTNFFAQGTNTTPSLFITSRSFWFVFLPAACLHLSQ